MNVLETLKQLKKLEADPAYTAISKRSILAIEPASVSRGWSAQRTFWKIIETGAAVALTGFFVMLLTGAFSGNVAPQYSAIDASALHAEAEAIDIQIQLSKLNYITPTGTAVSAAATQVVGKPSAAAIKQPAAPTASSASENATDTMSLDEALQSLTQ